MNVRRTEEVTSWHNGSGQQPAGDDGGCKFIHAERDQTCFMEGQVFQLPLSYRFTLHLREQHGNSTAEAECEHNVNYDMLLLRSPFLQRTDVHSTLGTHCAHCGRHPQEGHQAHCDFEILHVKRQGTRLICDFLSIVP